MRVVSEWEAVRYAEVLRELDAARAEVARLRNEVERSRKTLAEAERTIAEVERALTQFATWDERLDEAQLAIARHRTRQEADHG